MIVNKNIKNNTYIRTAPPLNLTELKENLSQAHITKMQILTLNFLIFTVGGVWRPIEWSSNIVKLLYDTFSLYVVASNYFLMLTQFMDIVLIVDNMDDFVTNSLLFVTVFAVCCKNTIAVRRRNAIIDLVQTLLKEPCKSRNKKEAAIQKKFDQFIRLWTIRYALLATGSVSSITIKSISDSMHGHLPFRVWLPYNTSTSLIFWGTAIHQMTTLISCTIINVGMETAVFGFFLQTCAQLEILETRLHRLIDNKTSGEREYCLLDVSNKENIISEYILHHLNIYKYAKTVNNVFNEVLFVQFFGSILVLCTSVYYLSMHVRESGAASLVVYTIGMFVQIYIYCWSGNEVILKSTSVGNSIYHMDWPSLSISEKKDLLMIMKRSTIPIKFTSSFLITLSIESYNNILKTSYSAFNVLQQSQY